MAVTFNEVNETRQQDLQDVKNQLINLIDDKLKKQDYYCLDEDGKCFEVRFVNDELTSTCGGNLHFDFYGIPSNQNPSREVCPFTYPGAFIPPSQISDTPLIYLYPITESLVRGVCKEYIAAGWERVYYNLKPNREFSIILSMNTDNSGVPKDDDFKLYVA
jgi:hypothetical protein